MRSFGFATLAVAGFLGMTQVASAADMRLPTKAPMMVAAHSWTGLYIGAHIGAGWGTSGWVDGPPLLTNLGSHGTSGIVGGGQVGFNWQTGALVLGVEAEGSWGNLSGNHIDLFASNLQTNVRNIYAISGRAGWAMNQVLLFAKAGGAWATFDYVDTFGAGILNGASSGTRSGYLLGLGAEYAFNRNWSAKAEYNYLNFGTQTLPFSGGVGGAFTQTISEYIHVLKFGVNYRFGM